MSGRRRSQLWKQKVRSGFELKIKQDLTERKVDFEYESEVFEYTIPESKHKYTPDFVIKRKGKRKKTLYLEAKGLLDSDARKKMVLVKAQHPDKDIRFLFQRDNPIRKGSKTKYSDWATKNGFEFAVGSEVPKEWLKG